MFGSIPFAASKNRTSPSPPPPTVHKDTTLFQDLPTVENVINRVEALISSPDQRKGGCCHLLMWLLREKRLIDVPVEAVGGSGLFLSFCCLIPTYNMLYNPHTQESAFVFKATAGTFHQRLLQVAVSACRLPVAVQTISPPQLNWSPNQSYTC